MTTKESSLRPRFPYPYIEPIAALPIGPPILAEGVAATAEEIPKQQEWMELYLDLFSGMGRATYLKRAERLGNYGWEPEDLRRVCSNPRELARLSGPEYSFALEDDIEALAALVHEASMYYSTGHTLALNHRMTYVARLSESGWSQTQLALLIGVSKQRVQALLKGWKKGQPKKRAVRG